MNFREVDKLSQAFLEHWKNLRQGSLTPRLRDFLDCPSPVHAPDLFILDIEGGYIRVRLQGTHLVERWGKEYTGKILYAQRSRAFRERHIGNLMTTISHPCGLFMIDEFVSTASRLSQAYVTFLPLQVDVGRAPSIVAYSRETSALFKLRDEVLAAKSRTIDAAWTDVGAGLPTEAPHKPID